jgi:hypothetical protein
LVLSRLCVADGCPVGVSVIKVRIKVEAREELVVHRFRE